MVSRSLRVVKEIWKLMMSDLRFIPITVQDGIESVSDGEDSAVGKLLSDCLLNEFISL